MRGSVARPAVAAVRSAAASCACAQSLRQSRELGRCEVVVLARRSRGGPDPLAATPCARASWLSVSSASVCGLFHAAKRTGSSWSRTRPGRACVRGGGGSGLTSSASQPPPHAHPTSLRATQSTMSTDRRAFKLKLLLASALLASLSPSHLLLLISPHRLTRPLTSLMPPNSRHGLPLPRARRRDCSRQPRPRRRLVPHVRRLLPLLAHRSRPLPPMACTRPLQRAAPS